MAESVNCFAGDFEKVLDCFRNTHPKILLDDKEWGLVKGLLDGRRKAKEDRSNPGAFVKEWQETVVTTLGGGRKLSENEKDKLIDNFLNKAGVFVQAITHHFSAS